MFSLKIHTVDTPHPIFPTPFTTTTTKQSLKKPQNDAVLNPAQLNGVVHLFRNVPPATSSSAAALFNTAARTTALFVVAVPGYVSPEDFLQFCGKHVEDFADVIFIRNDGTEDRYSVLIRLVSQVSSDGFYCNYNGKRFKPSEPEVCHIYFTQSVEYLDSAEIASITLPGFTELPTCPICLERLDQDTSAIQFSHCDHSFHCSCVSRWTYSSCQVCRLCQQQDVKPTCAVCGRSENPWVCLICGFVGCGRYEEGKHAIRHWKDTQHCYSLELKTKEIWDYAGDKYVQRLAHSKVDGKLGGKNFHSASLTKENGACDDEDSGMNSALFNSKVEAIIDEYNELLATQLETQRQHYAPLLAEARNRLERVVPEAVESAPIAKEQEIQNQSDEVAKHNITVTNKIKDITEENEVSKKRFKEIEERERLTLKSCNEKILDLEEQIRDMKIFKQAQRTVANMADADSIKGGTLLPVQASQSQAGTHSKRRLKSGRRRS